MINNYLINNKIMILKMMNNINKDFLKLKRRFLKDKLEEELGFQMLNLNVFNKI